MPDFSSMSVPELYAVNPAAMHRIYAAAVAEKNLEVSEDQVLEDELENVPMTESCDTIRRKIRTLIDNGDMRVGQFQKEINVTGGAYSRFMSQHGPDNGAGSSVYLSAWAFFKKRELRGIKTVRNKKASATTAAADASKTPDVNDIELDRECDDEVPIYDTCDDVRRKINAHLKKPGVTQAAFLRAASASFHTVSKKLTSQALSKFRSKKGPYEGNTMDIFYGAYVYFEKLRIKEGKPKSKKRTEMEDLHQPHFMNNFRGGLQTDRRMERFIGPADKSPYIDSYGLIKWY